jgi:hypothetical protein
MRSSSIAVWSRSCTRPANGYGRLAHRNRSPFQGSSLKFIGREDFIAMKVFAGGPVDLIDAKRAICAAGNSLDLDLLHRVAKRYGRDAAESLERLLAG